MSAAARILGEVGRAVLRCSGERRACVRSEPRLARGGGAGRVVTLARGVWPRFALAALLLGATAGCGLLGLAGDGELGFRAYPLPEVPYSEAQALVRSVVRDFYAERFTGAGGFTLDWDPTTGRLSASPVLAGDRRLRLYLAMQPEGTGTRLEMFALVETMDEASTLGPRWTNPQQDVPLEERLYEAILEEHLRRRSARDSGGGS